VLGGMIAATAFGIYFVPLFYLWVRGLAGRLSRPRAASAADAAPEATT
jgi:hypothetical protein